MKSVLEAINAEYSLEGLMLKLKLQYFGHLVRTADTLEKTLMLGKMEGRRRRGWQDEMVGWHHRLNRHEYKQTLGDSKGQGGLMWCSPWGGKEADTIEQLNNNNKGISILQFSSVAQSCPTLCDPMNHSMPGLPVHHQLLEFTQTHIHRVSDVIQPSHALSSPSPPAVNLSPQQGLFKWVSSSYQVVKILEFQL